NAVASHDKYGRSPGSWCDASPAGAVLDSRWRSSAATAAIRRVILPGTIGSWLRSSVLRARGKSMAPQLISLEPELSVAGRLDRPDIEALAHAGVRTIVNNRPDGEDRGQLPAAEARRLAETLGMAYHHIPIT